MPDLLLDLLLAYCLPDYPVPLSGHRAFMSESTFGGGLLAPFALRARGSLLAHPSGMVTSNAFVHPPPSLIAHSSGMTGNAFVHRRVLTCSAGCLSCFARPFLFLSVEPHLSLVLRRFPVHALGVLLRFLRSLPVFSPAAVPLNSLQERN